MNFRESVSKLEINSGNWRTRVTMGLKESPMSPRAENKHSMTEVKDRLTAMVTMLGKQQIQSNSKEFTASQHPRTVNRQHQVQSESFFGESKSTIPQKASTERLEFLDGGVTRLCKPKVHTEALSAMDSQWNTTRKKTNSHKLNSSLRTIDSLVSSQNLSQVPLLNCEQNRDDFPLGYRAGSLNVESTESKLKKIEMPNFDGSHAHDWLGEIEHFFAVGLFREEDKLDVVAFSMKGKANKWFAWVWGHGGFSDWSDFEHKLLTRFDGLIQSCSAQEVTFKHDSISEIHQDSGLSCEIASIDGVVKTDSFLRHESVNSMNLEHDSVQKRYLPSPLQNTVEIQHQTSSQNINLTEEIVSHIVLESEETEVWQNNADIAEIMIRNDSFLEADQEGEDDVNLDDEFSKKVIVHEAAGAQMTDPPVMDETVYVRSSLLHTNCFRDLVSSMEDSSTKSVGIQVTAVKEKAVIPQPKINVIGADLKQQQGRTQFLLLIFKEFGSSQRPWLRSELETQSSIFQLWHRWKNKVGISSLIFTNEKCELLTVMQGHDMLSENKIIIHGSQFNCLLVFDWEKRLLKETVRRQHTLRMRQFLQALKQFTLTTGDFHVKHRWRSKSVKFLNVAEHLVNLATMRVTVFNFRDEATLIHMVFSRVQIQAVIVQVMLLFGSCVHTDCEGLMLMARDILLLQKIGSFQHDLELSAVFCQWFGFYETLVHSHLHSAYKVLQQGFSFIVSDNWKELQTHGSFQGSSPIILLSISLRASLFSRRGVYKRTLDGWLIVDVLIGLFSSATESDIIDQNVRKQEKKMEARIHWVVHMENQQRGSLLMHIRRCLLQVLVQQKRRLKKWYKSMMFKYKQRVVEHMIKVNTKVDLQYCSLNCDAFDKILCSFYCSTVVASVSNYKLEGKLIVRGKY